MIKLSGIKTWFPYIMLSVCLVLFAACGNTEDEDRRQTEAGSETASQYLGKSEKALVDAKGKGIENKSIVDGEEIILSRVYKEKFLGFDSELTVMLSSDGVVEYLLYSMNGEKDQVVTAINGFLGKSEPDQVEEKDANIGYKAIWRQDKYIYTMIAEENQISVAIIKE